MSSSRCAPTLPQVRTKEQGHPLLAEMLGQSEPNALTETSHKKLALTEKKKERERERARERERERETERHTCTHAHTHTYKPKRVHARLHVHAGDETMLRVQDVGHLRCQPHEAAKRLSKILRKKPRVIRRGARPQRLCNRLPRTSVHPEDDS